MDVFLIDGMEIIFRLAVAILTFGKEDLLSLDMEGMLKVIIQQLSTHRIRSDDGVIEFPISWFCPASLLILC